MIDLDAVLLRLQKGEPEVLLGSMFVLWGEDIEDISQALSELAARAKPLGIVLMSGRVGHHEEIWAALEVKA